LPLSSTDHRIVNGDFPSRTGVSRNASGLEPLNPHETWCASQEMTMKRRLIGTVAVTSLGAVLAVATPAMAQKSHGGGMSHGAGVAAARVGPAPSIGGGAATMSRGSAQIGSGGRAAFQGNMNRGGAWATRNMANNNWSGRNWSGGNWAGRNWAGRHRHLHGHNRFALGFAFGAPYYDEPWYDTYGYGDGYYVEPASDDAAVQYCINHFKSYDLASQTYRGYDGRRHSCP
jgi:hypothetical protein